MSKSKTVYLYFSARGYSLLSHKNEPLSLRVMKGELGTPEEKERRCWFYLGFGLKEALDDGFEFVNIISDSKIIDQLRGAHIDDPECIALRDTIVKRGLTRFIWFEQKKATPEEMSRVFKTARERLTGLQDDAAT